MPGAITNQAQLVVSHLAFSFPFLQHFVQDAQVPTSEKADFRGHIMAAATDETDRNWP